MSVRISDRLFRNYLHCKYKAYQILSAKVELGATTRNFKMIRQNLRGRSTQDCRSNACKCNMG